MSRIRISKSHLGLNPFVDAVEQGLKSWANPYPIVYYEYDGNEAQVDNEYYTIASDVKQYLEDIKDQIDELPISEVEYQDMTIELIEPKYLARNKDLNSQDDDYYHNGFIVFEGKSDADYDYYGLPINDVS